MIGDNIGKIRKQKGFSLSELAERAGISKSYLSNIERNVNHNPSIHVIEKIAAVLDVDLQLLLNADETVKSKQIPDREWLDLAQELKESGIDKKQIKEYRTLIEFIKWQNRNID